MNNSDDRDYKDQILGPSNEYVKTLHKNWDRNVNYYINLETAETNFTAENDRRSIPTR